jgi:tight adherence protein B
MEFYKKQKTHFRTKRNSQAQINYQEYEYTLFSWFEIFMQGMIIVGIISFIFYSNIVAFFTLLPIAFLFPSFKKKNLREKRKEKLNGEFKEAILSLSSSLSAGYSVENACKEAEKEMIVMFGSNSLIGNELHRIVCGIELNIPVEELLDDLGKRSNLEDVRNFTEVFKISKRTGGDLPSIIRQTVETIDEKMKVREEIITMTTSVRYEGKVMSIIPSGIILYIKFASPDFFEPLYTTLFGRIFMTACLGIYLATIVLQQKIMEVDI